MCGYGFLQSAKACDIARLHLGASFLIFTSLVAYTALLPLNKLTACLMVHRRSDIASCCPVMAEIDFGESLNGVRQSTRADSTKVKVGDFNWWEHAVHKTGFMEDLSTDAILPHRHGAREDGGDSEISSDDGSEPIVGDSGDEEDSDNEDPKFAKRIDDAIKALTPSDDEVLKLAFALFDHGRRTRAHNKSSQQALPYTPEVFKEEGITLMPHQLSEAGRQRTILRDDEVMLLTDESAANAHTPADTDEARETTLLKQMPGSIMAFEMGLGKTVVAIGKLLYLVLDLTDTLTAYKDAANSLLKSGSKFPILIVTPVSLLTMWRENLDLYLETCYLEYSKL
jgi:hypothetical protein